MFPHAVNMVVNDDLWTLLAAHKADLPFGIRVATETLTGLRVHTGDQVRVRGGFVSLGGQTVVDCRAAPRWRAKAPFALVPGLERRLSIIERAAAARAWWQSAPMAWKVVGCLARDSDVAANVLAQVIGSGPGLTPAGDDVLAGILAVLALPLTGDRGRIARTMLAGLVCPLIPGTTSLAGHMLWQAVEGNFARPMHDLLHALAVAPSRTNLDQAIACMLEIGATSGADAFMGVVAAARGFLSCDTFEEAA